MGQGPGTRQNTPEYSRVLRPWLRDVPREESRWGLPSLSPRLPCPGNPRRPVGVGSPTGVPAAEPRRGSAPSLVQGLRLPRGFALSRQGPVPCPGTAADLGSPCPGRKPPPFGEPRVCRVGLPCPGRDPFLVQELRLNPWVCLVQAGTRSLSGSQEMPRGYALSRQGPVPYPGTVAASWVCLVQAGTRSLSGSRT